jgi:hypothetical protein
MLGVLTLTSVLLALVVGSACYPTAPEPPAWGGAQGNRVTSSSGQSFAPPITFAAKIDGHFEGRPGTRVMRNWGLAWDVNDFDKLVFTWTPPPGATNFGFVTEPELGGPPFVFRNVAPGPLSLREIQYDLPPYPPGAATQKIVESLEASYQGAVSVASLTTYMPNAFSLTCRRTPGRSPRTCATRERTSPSRGRRRWVAWLPQARAWMPSRRRG